MGEASRTGYRIFRVGGGGRGIFFTPARVWHHMSRLRYAMTAWVLSSAAFSQTPPAREFEVASIRPSAPFAGRVNLHVQVDGSQVHCTYFSLKDYLTMAYTVKDY